VIKPIEQRNSQEDSLRVATNQIRKRGQKSMCISKEVLDQKVATIREYKSIKKDAEANLKPLEQEVKEFMEETNQTSYIGYGYSISYKEQEKETVVKEKVLELLNNPKISKVIEAENIDASALFKTTIIRPLKIS